MLGAASYPDTGKSYTAQVYLGSIDLFMSKNKGALGAKTQCGLSVFAGDMQKAENAVRDMLLLNDSFHEIGHGLSVIGDSPSHTGVMGYPFFDDPVNYFKFGTYPSNFIDAINKRFK